MDIERRLNPEYQDKCVANISDEFLINQLFKPIVEKDDKASVYSDNKVTPLPSVKIQLKSMALGKLLRDSYSATDAMQSTL